MKQQLRWWTLVVLVPLLGATAFTYVRHHQMKLDAVVERNLGDELNLDEVIEQENPYEVVEQELFYDVDPDLSPLNAWKDRWGAQVKHLKMIGGCDCHVAQFSVRATRAAISDIPNKYNYETGFRID